MPPSESITDQETIERIADARPSDPLEQQRVGESVEARLFGRRARPITFGRYVLLERLGSGGGGLVHAAYDPELDRRVAIKLIGTRLDATEDLNTKGARLLREAQAMAQLSHPNVIAVFDVGTYGPEQIARLPDPVERTVRLGQGIYVVMELINGPDLGEWLRAETRPWREVLSKFIAAGRGLEAAHSANLVHRDFKPANVLIGSDGRVRVLDFGLARAVDEPSGESTPGRSSTRALDDPLTMSGTVMGTPAYMSPEQHRGQPASEASDQYSFCVALFEALHGTRPFPGKDLQALLIAKDEGAIAELGETRKVPVWVHRALVRGLAPEASRRFPDMRTLLDVLEDDPGRRARRWAVAALAAVTVAGVGYAGVRTATFDPCADQAADLGGIWDVDSREAIRTAFAATDLPFAAASWDNVRQRLDDYTEGWIELRTEVCRDTLVEQRHPMTVMSERMLCLDRRLARLGGLTRSFAAATPDTVERSVSAAASLPALAPCARAGLGAALHEASRDDVLGVESDLAEAEALRFAVRHERASEAAERALARARALGDPATLSRAWSEVAQCEQALGDPTASEAALRESLFAAERARDDELAARAMVSLAVTVGDFLARSEEGVRLADHAAAKIAAAGLEDSLSAELELNRGRALETGGRYAEAMAAFEQALELTRRYDGDDHPRVATIHNLMGVGLDRQGRYREALEHYQRALDSRRKTLGDQHPTTGLTLANTAIMKGYLGRYREAVHELEEAVTVMETGAARETATLAWFVSALGWALGDVDRHEEALAQHRRAREIRERTLGQDHPEFGMSLSAIAESLLSLERASEALPLAQRAVEIRERDAPNHPRLAGLLLVVGRAHAKLGDHTQAIAVLERARDHARATLGSDHPTLGYILEALAGSVLAIGDHGRAAKLANRAVEIMVAKELPGLPLASARFLLARTLLDADPTRALGSAREALAAYQASDLRRPERAEVEAWLARHGR